MLVYAENRFQFSISSGKLRNLSHLRDVDSPASELDLELHHQGLGALHRVRDVDDLGHRAIAAGGDRREKRQTKQEKI